MGRSKSKKKFNFKKLKNKIKKRKYHLVLFFICLILWGIYTPLINEYRVYSLQRERTLFGFWRKTEVAVFLPEYHVKVYKT